MLRGVEDRGDSVVGILDPLGDEPDDAVSSEGQTNKGAKNCRRQNDEHCGITP